MFVSSNLLRDLLPYFKRKLKAVYDEQETESIFFLICHQRFGLGKAAVLQGDKRLTESELLEFREIVNRLGTHEPIQYILGETEFYGNRFRVNREVLIPRPETEELVDIVVGNHKQSENLRILDIATGSGCIPISLSLNLKKSLVTATDISEAALTIANQNALALKSQVRFLELDVFSDQMETLGQFDLIISNPPYVPQSDRFSMSKNVLEFEPHLALFVPDSDPIRFYKTIVNFAKNHLTETGVVYFELHPAHATEVVEYAQMLGFTNSSIRKDLSGNRRFAILSKN